MDSFAYFSAFWLGILTAVSPCPLATNIAAISFMSKNIQNRSKVLKSGVSYTMGRTAVYVLLGVAISSGLFAVQAISSFLQKYMNDILGPVMIVLGMVLLGWLGSSVSFNLVNDSIREKAEKGSLTWDFIIGGLFALSFCPASAGLFFAGIIPIAIKAETNVIFPAFYVIGTAIPVIFFAILIAFSAKYVGTAFNKLSHAEKWVQNIAGILFILAGIFYCISFSFAL